MDDEEITVTVVVIGTESVISICGVVFRSVALLVGVVIDSVTVIYCDICDSVTGWVNVIGSVTVIYCGVRDSLTSSAGVVGDSVTGIGVVVRDSVYAVISFVDEVVVRPDNVDLFRCVTVFVE